MMDDHFALEIHGLDFQRDLECHALGLRGALDELAENLEAIVQDERKLSEPAEWNGVLELRKHIGGADEEQPLAIQRGDARGIVKLRIIAKGHVQLARRSGVEELIAQALAQGNPKSGVAGASLEQFGRQNATASRGDAERDLARKSISEPIHGALGPAHPLQHILRMRKQHLAGFGQQNTSGMAKQQFDAQFRFQLLDLIAESRLGDVQFTAGANKTSGTDDRYEISQLTQIHVCVPCSVGDPPSCGQLRYINRPRFELGGLSCDVASWWTGLSIHVY